MFFEETMLNNFFFHLYCHNPSLLQYPISGMYWSFCCSLDFTL